MYTAIEGKNGLLNDKKTELLTNNSQLQETLVFKGEIVWR